MRWLSNYALTISVFLLYAFLVSSCGTNKKITYFQDVPDSLYLQSKNVISAPFIEPVIQPNDILQIAILTLDPRGNDILTAANSSSYSTQPGSSNATAAPPAVTGFLVDNAGWVEVPIIGKVKVGGMTTAVARDSIHTKVAVYYKNPVVSVRFANFNITVLGEVARPATYIVPSEKVSILDAIGMAGDLTIYGKRENVLLIRDSLGVKKMMRFDLNSTSTLLSPYFYLRQGDVVYVEPAKSKIAASDAVKTRNITLLGAGLSLLIVIFSRF
jgi:polysaccharide export outer membrane protein